MTMGEQAVVVWHNGSLVDPANAAVRWDDHGLTVGDGVFETIKIVGTDPFALEVHLERLERSAAGLGFEAPPRGTLTEAIGSVATAWAALAGDQSIGRLRVTVTTGVGPAGSGRGEGPPTVLVTASHMELTREPTAVITVDWTRNENGALSGLKTTSYAENVVALARAHELGASEALFANTRGELCEGTGTNVFIEHAGTLATPPLETGCLDGITRRLLLDVLASQEIRVDEVRLPIEAVLDTAEAFLVSTGREVQPIASVNGVALPSAPGPLTLRAMSAWDSAFG